MVKETNKEKALVALLNARSVAEASRQCSIPVRTLFRYLEDSKFRKEYRKARSSMVEIAIASMQSAIGEGVDTLIRNLNCENPAVETRAAQILIEMSKGGVETFDILERLERLEALESEHSK